MVDNRNNQWEEESEYNSDDVLDNETDSQDEDLYDDTESSEEDTEDEYSEYEDEDGEEDDEEEENSEPSSQKKNIIPLIIIVVVLLLVGLFVLVPKLSNNGVTVNNVSVTNKTDKTVQNTNDNQQSPSTSDADAFFGESGENDNNMMSVDFNNPDQSVNVTTGEGENQQVATVSEAQPGEGINENDLFAEQPSQENDSIMVVYNKASRSNPFKPPVTIDTAETPFETINNTQFEIIEPPVTSVQDEHLTKLLQTEISGIMYDEKSPAAIVKIEGIDQFVKVGDVVSGFKIVNITNDKVQISYKNNSYVASVGELFTKGSIDLKPAVVNLESKFAGRYRNNNN